MTLEQAQTELAYWIAKSRTLAAGQSITFQSGGVSRGISASSTNAALEWVKYWQGQVAALTPGRVRYGEYDRK